MILRHVSWMGLLALVACSSQEGDVAEHGAALSQDCPTAPAPRLTPSNLPANICDTPGASALDVPDGPYVYLDGNVPCDAVVAQANGLPNICVRKFSNVSIHGGWKVGGGAPAGHVLAIVATGSFTLDANGTIDTQPPQPQGPGFPNGTGAGQNGALGGGGGGAGYVTAGAAGAGASSDGGAAGSAYGPTTGTQLVPGSRGGDGVGKYGLAGPGGWGGGALQLVACGTMNLSGSVSTKGTAGSSGADHTMMGDSGAGGGSGGTLLVEAAAVTGSGGRLLSVGGNGGDGGCAYSGGLAAITAGSGGAGGTGSSPPQPGTSVSNCSGGGGGGSVGRILIDVPQGTPVPAIASDPPATLGTVATH